ncbi:glutamate--tRNA ligase [Thermoflexus sp.]|uniref:glutamate--tRNA ligase n=1 Tax=Thermoflexus sp. TaxID=1969742 RepID=UPI0035E44DD7
MSVRVRFAPSPTGFLHVGGARTALFNWLFARHHGGQFILRIEDTDRKRLIPGALEDILDSLRWLGLDWDEGPDVGGPYGPYIQSQRLEIYQEHAHRLVAMGHAYYCFCSEERLERLRREQEARKQPTGYDRFCRYNVSPEEAQHRIAAGEPYVIRLKAPLEGTTTFRDLVHGEISVQNRTQDDFVLLKSDGYPTYHLANVVDDHLMRITHVMRADEWIPSTPRHILLYRAFGWEPPQFAHLPIILSPTGKGKMSKRMLQEQGRWETAVFVRDFREEGYLPEALVNFLALTGWAYDDKTELFTVEELIEKFDISGINPKPAAFNYEKLEWMNGVYIRRLTVEALADRLRPYLEALDLRPDPETLRRAIPLIQERIKTLREGAEMLEFLWREEISPTLEDLVPKGNTPEEVRTWLAEASQVLERLPEFTHEAIEAALRGLADRLGVKAGTLFMAIRVAVTGRRVTPPLFESIALLGRPRTLARLEGAIRLLERVPSS